METPLGSKITVGSDGKCDELTPQLKGDSNSSNMSDSCLMGKPAHSISSSDTLSQNPDFYMKFHLY